MIWKNNNIVDVYIVLAYFQHKKIQKKFKRISIHFFETAVNYAILFSHQNMFQKFLKHVFFWKLSIFRFFFFFFQIQTHDTTHAGTFNISPYWNMSQNFLFSFNKKKWKNMFQNVFKSKKNSLASVYIITKKQKKNSDNFNNFRIKKIFFFWIQSKLRNIFLISKHIFQKIFETCFFFWKFSNFNYFFLKIFLNQIAIPKNSQHSTFPTACTFFSNRVLTGISDDSYSPVRVLFPLTHLYFYVNAHNNCTAGAHSGRKNWFLKSRKFSGISRIGIFWKFWK